MKIYVNGEDHEVDGAMLSYEEIVFKAVKGLVSGESRFNVSYRGTFGQPQTIVASERVYPEEGMHFVVRRQ